MAKQDQAIALARRLLDSLGGTDSKSSPRLATYARTWLTEREGTVAPATITFYRYLATTIGGTRLGRMPLAKITRQDVAEWLQDVAKDRAARTANHALKWLRMVMRSAEDDELIARNPATRVKTLRVDASTRRAFTLDELRRLVTSADEEWQTLIYFGLYTGQRLGDLARLTWSQVDLERGEVRMVTAKTGRLQILPLAPPLVPRSPALCITAPVAANAPPLAVGFGGSGSLAGAALTPSPSPLGRVRSQGLGLPASA